MATADELQAVLEQVARQEGSAGDLQLLQQALARGEITAVSGERAVAIGGDARDLTIITGDYNLVFNGVDARILREVLVANSYREDHILVLLLPIALAVFSFMMLLAVLYILNIRQEGQSGGQDLVILIIALVSGSLILSFILRFLMKWKTFKPRSGAGETMVQPTGYAQQTPTAPDQPQAAVIEESVYGGLLGGALAGILNGISYWYDSGNADGRLTIPYIFIYCCLAGMVLGYVTQKGTLISHRHRSSLRDVLGSTLGGAFAGIGLGAVAGSFFGGWSTAIHSGVLLVSVALGSMCIAIAIRWHIYRWARKNALRAVVVAFFIAFVLLLMAVMTLSESIDSLIRIFFIEPSGPEAEFWNIGGGAMLGIVLGATLGFIVGLTAYLYDRWEHPRLSVHVRPKNEEKPQSAE
jgi:hypothetical protein